MTCTLYGLCHAALELQRSAGNATRQDLSLFVEELLEELIPLFLKRQYFFFLTSTVGGVK